MLIDTEAFMLAAVGGVLIGLSATLLMWLNGRILGVSGLVGGLLALSSDDRAMRFAFLAGVVVTGLAGAVITAQRQQTADQTADPEYASVQPHE